MATFDRKAKSNLYEVYAQIEDILKSKHFFPEIEDELTAEFGDIIKVIYRQKSDVCEEICPIVITGLFFLLDLQVNFLRYVFDLLDFKIEHY